ncbi:uroporphyrinogen-III synthase [Rothia halotolerans]|uniref:uroporphyrinogen-III synthase n=1 Tax=Rothia halotolerans TaxID=405770 RepID=UPI00101B8316|nr:uroporphyrinogen-III synthase [Rothia halotolerans]
MPTSSDLAGFRVHLTAQRRSEDIDAALSRRGAEIFHCPSMVTTPVDDDEQLPGRTREIIAFAPQIVIVTTGIGLRGWLASAEAHGLRDELLARLGEARIIARGAKANGAIRAVGLEAEWTSPEETAEDVLRYLREGDLAGRRVAVQHHGMGTDGLEESLREAGAEPLGVVVYRYVVPADPEPVRRSVREAAEGGADAVIFTAAGGSIEWLRAADAVQLAALAERTRREELGLFAVGPVTARPLEEAGLRVHVPPRYRLGAMLRQVAAWGIERRGGDAVPTAPAGAVAEPETYGDAAPSGPTAEPETHEDDAP